MNLNLVVNSRFKPFSYQELLAPALMATEAHEKRQEAYDKLAEDSSKWGEQLDPSSQAYGMWKSFQDEITQAADDLSSQGLTIGNRKALSNVRKSYGQKIKAIEEADKRLQAQAALRQQMQAKDSSIEYKSGLKIDDFLHGRQGSNESLSGATMRAETADMASKLGQSIYSNPSFSKVMGGSYWQIAQANGYSPDVLGYIRSGEWRNLPHGKNASDADNKLYNDIKQVSDLYQSQINRTQGYSQDAQARLGEQIFQGLYSGLEKPKYDFQRNMDYMSAAERASNALGRDNLAQRKTEFDEQMKLQRALYGLDKDYKPVSTPIKGSKSGDSKSKTEKVDRIKQPVVIATFYQGDVGDRDTDETGIHKTKTAEVAGKYTQIKEENGTYNVSGAFDNTPTIKAYEELNIYEKKQADKQTKGDPNKDAYIYYTGRVNGHIHGIAVVPKSTINTNKQEIDEDTY